VTFLAKNFSRAALCSLRHYVMSWSCAWTEDGVSRPRRHNSSLLVMDHGGSWQEKKEKASDEGSRSESVVGVVVRSKPNLSSPELWLEQRPKPHPDGGSGVATSCRCRHTGTVRVNNMLYLSIQQPATFDQAKNHHRTISDQPSCSH
jgi:hypothetical protein